MALIKNREITEDSWVQLDDETPVPSEGGAIVSISRWRKDRVALSSRNAPIGVQLESDNGPEDVLDGLDRLDLIAVPFATFKDGRGYSTARLLRERHGFTGELRAVGNVLRDQLPLMERCGFDSFQYVGGTEALVALKAFKDIGAVYQTAADRRASAAALRNHPSQAFSNGTCG
ncbi:MAG: DUF934 domain-containing protein [Alphaproteobacteria bacterium]|jgi:uncharacterized protein (DUF934 family)|nr:DUF934 domain-containing protein [Alphaproteobacteria bacterium]